MTAGLLFQIFLVSAVSTILLTRAYLSLTGYPQVGAGSLHIAHVLWGGLLMLAASLINFASLSWRSTLLSATLSGVGFGLFIDEVGKFLTKDNDYFFRPASVIMYLLFLFLILLFQRLAKSQTYSSEERSVNAMRLLEQVFGHDLQTSEKHKALQLLKASSQSDPQAAALRTFVASIPEHRLVPQSGFTMRMERMRQSIRHWAAGRYVLQAMTTGLVLLAAGSLGLSLRSFVTTATLPSCVALLGALVMAILVTIGLLKRRQNPELTRQWFVKALVFDFLAVEPFLFYSEQFAAAYGLLFKLLLWLYFASNTSKK